MKIKSVTRSKKDKEGKVTIYIRISDANETRYISTGLKVKPKHWNKRLGVVRTNDDYDADAMNKIISDKLKKVKDERYRLIADNQTVDVDLLKKKSISNDGEGDFLEFAKNFAFRKRKVNVQTGRRYDGIISKVSSFSKGKLEFKDITPSWLKKFEDWLSNERKNSANTIHSNLRAIRAIYRDAIKAGVVSKEKYPFFNYPLKQPKVSKTKLLFEEVKAFSSVEPESKFQELTQDLFLFSFFTQGMRFRDVSMLRYKNYNKEVIRYEMHKTKADINIKLSRLAKAIIHKYYIDDAKPETFLFPIIDVNKVLSQLRPLDDSLTVKDLKFGEAVTERLRTIQKSLDKDISSKNTYVNSQLKEIAKKAGINKNLTFHVARHTYSDIARRKKANIHELSQSLGHSSVKVTEHYLDSLGHEATNSAAETVYEDF